MKKIEIIITDDKMEIKHEGVNTLELIGALTFYRDSALIKQLNNIRIKVVFIYSYILMKRISGSFSILLNTKIVKFDLIM